MLLPGQGRTLFVVSLGRLPLFALVSLAWACEPPLDLDPLSDLPSGDEQLRALCERGRQDAVSRAFCTDVPPRLTGLIDLQRVLSLRPVPEEGAAAASLALTGHSTGLFGRGVSAINPRAIVLQFPEDRADQNFIALAYARGEQVVELAAQAPDDQGRAAPTFYLLRYSQLCTHDDDGDGRADGDRQGDCTVTDTLGERTESEWTGWSLYDDADLENTVFDCLHCHQPLGPGTKRLFRQQELQNPWTHWMAPFSPSRVLLDDYRLVHGDAGVAGIPTSRFAASNPILVQNLVERTGSTQDNLFPSPIIEAEVVAAAPGQPADNTVTGSSATWRALFERARRGEAIPPPFHDIKVTDPDRVLDLAARYRAAVDVPGAQLPDLRTALRLEAEVGTFVRAASGQSGRALLVQMCAQCHNGRSEPSLSKSNFDVFRLDDMTDAERDVILDRLRRPSKDRYRMPPTFLRELTPDEIDTIERFLHER